MNINDLKPGQRVRVWQTVDRREGPWRGEVVGVILSVRPEKTESWYAHGKDDKFWLYRLRLRKDDGEITTLAMDQHTEIEVLAEGVAPAP